MIWYFVVAFSLVGLVLSYRVKWRLRRLRAEARADYVAALARWRHLGFLGDDDPGEMDVIQMMRHDGPADWEELQDRERSFLELQRVARGLSGPAFFYLVHLLPRDKAKALRFLRASDADPETNRMSESQKDYFLDYWAAPRHRVDAAERHGVEGDLLDWLQTRAPRNADLLHRLPGLNWDYPQLWGILLWAVQRPECDEATALDILYLAQASDLLGEVLQGRGPKDWRASDKYRLIATTCDRLARDDFASKRLAPLAVPRGEVAALLAGLKDKLTAAGVPFDRAPWPVPDRLATLQPGTEDTDRHYEALDDELVVYPGS